MTPLAYKLVALAVLLLAVLFLGALGVAVKDLFRDMAAEDWPAVEGKVAESKTVRGCYIGSRHYPTSHSPLVIYSYVYEGKTYRNSQIAFGPKLCVGEPLAQSVASAYPAGALVKVWVNPKAPAEATLEVPDGTRNAWLALLLTPVLLMGAIWLVRDFRRGTDSV
jgi:hypothetical protein